MKTGWGKIPYKCQNSITTIKTNTIIKGSHFRAKKKLSNYQHSNSYGILPHKHSAWPLRTLQSLPLRPLMSSTRWQPCCLIYSCLHHSSALGLSSTCIFAQFPRLYFLRYYFYSITPFFKGPFGPTLLSWLQNKNQYPKQEKVRKPETAPPFYFNPSHTFTKIMEQECNLKPSLQTSRKK